MKTLTSTQAAEFLQRLRELIAVENTDGKRGRSSNLKRVNYGEDEFIRALTVALEAAAKGQDKFQFSFFDNYVGCYQKSSGQYMGSHYNGISPPNHVGDLTVTTDDANKKIGDGTYQLPAALHHLLTISKPAGETNPSSVSFPGVFITATAQEDARTFMMDLCETLELKDTFKELGKANYAIQPEPAKAEPSLLGRIANKFMPSGGAGSAGGSTSKAKPAASSDPSKAMKKGSS